MLAIAGIIYQGGVVTARVQQNTDKIIKLEAADAIKTQALSDINLRGARNEAKLDFIAERMQDAPSKRRRE